MKAYYLSYWVIELLDMYVAKLSLFHCMFIFSFLTLDMLLKKRRDKESESDEKGMLEKK